MGTRPEHRGSPGGGQAGTSDADLERPSEFASLLGEEYVAAMLGK